MTSVEFYRNHIIVFFSITVLLNDAEHGCLQDNGQRQNTYAKDSYPFGGLHWAPKKFQVTEASKSSIAQYNEVDRWRIQWTVN